MSYREPRLPPYPPGGPTANTPARPQRPPHAPLTQRMRTGHWIAIDCVVAAFSALFVLIAVHRAFFGTGQMWLAIGLLMAAAVFVAVALRRRAPVMAFGGLLLLAVLFGDMASGFMFPGAAVAALSLVFLSAAYVLYTVTVTSSRRTGGAALALALALLVFIGGTARSRSEGAPALLVPVGLASVIAWMTGYSVRQRRLYVVRLQQQAATSAVADERLRIARELHDVVAHSMSVIAVQAGYGQYVIDVSPDGARDALGAIQATSRDALDEMRRMLGVLRQQDIAPIPRQTVSLGRDDSLGAGSAPMARTDAAPLAPAPGLADLARLINRTGGAGVRVTLGVSGKARLVPSGIDLSAYRIIQEALTNVVKHAGPSACCTVNLYYGVTTLDVRVLDDGGAAPGTAAGRGAPRTPAIGAGHGIVGMRERVNLCGGTLKAGPLAEGGFLVAATLPVPQPADDDRGDAPGEAIPDENALAGNAFAGGQA